MANRNVPQIPPPFFPFSILFVGMKWKTFHQFEKKRVIQKNIENDGQYVYNLYTVDCASQHVHSRFTECTLIARGLSLEFEMNGSEWL